MTYRIMGKTGSLNASRPGCFLGFALFWIAFSSIFVIIGLTTKAGLAFTIFGFAFVGIGLALLVYALLAYYARFRVGQPNFTLSQTTLRVGDRFTFSISHTFPRSVLITDIHTDLIFRERATYQQGTDTKTVTYDHVIKSYEEPGGQFRAGQLFAKSYQLQIPPEAMHTLKVRRNELTWLLKFQAGIPKMPDYLEEFELIVLPEISQ
ncbi:MAG: hypothetical protein H6659_08575 [Ardenticatenaceae bacterium]|nr:hypothetical protein [Ardenticatenaceae bacterium]MCB8988844.1 hypothetical protein [Ardenticatenaceae bacterium]